MQEPPVQILEVRAADGERAATITAAVTADASRAIFSALTEALDQRRREPIENADDVLALREQTALLERFQPLASADSNAMFAFGEADLRACLLALSDYVARLDGEHFQPPELRERLQLIAEMTPVLWDANAATAAVAGGELLTPAV